MSGPIRTIAIENCEKTPDRLLGMVARWLYVVSEKSTGLTDRNARAVYLGLASHSHVVASSQPNLLLVKEFTARDYAVRADEELAEITGLSRAQFRRGMRGLLLSNLVEAVYVSLGGSSEVPAYRIVPAPQVISGKSDLGTSAIDEPIGTLVRSLYHKNTGRNGRGPENDVCVALATLADQRVYENAGLFVARPGRDAILSRSQVGVSAFLKAQRRLLADRLIDFVSLGKPPRRHYQIRFPAIVSAAPVAANGSTGNEFKNSVIVTSNRDAAGVTTLTLTFEGEDARGEYYKMAFEGMDLQLAESVADGIKNIVKSAKKRN